ncbi:MAG: RNA polymerase sigma factor [Bacteroidota bacterium]
MNNPFAADYLTDENDKALIDRATHGDKAALEDLLKKHQPFVYNIAWKMVQNPMDAEDLAQEVMIKVITNLAKFEGKSQFRTWLYRIVVNHFLQIQKKPREIIANEDFDGFADRLASFQDVVLSELEQEEMKAEIREMNLACMSAMLLCLTREQRMIYIIGDLFNADHTIGAKILNLSKDNYRKRLSRARKDLFSFMNNKCGLVNKANPCRCYKKVTAVMECGNIDSKHLLFNRKEYKKFQNYISKDTDEILDLVEEKYHEMHYELPYREDFDKRTLIDDFIKDKRVVELLNLN